MNPKSLFFGWLTIIGLVAATIILVIGMSYLLTKLQTKNGYYIIKPESGEAIHAKQITFTRGNTITYIADDGSSGYIFGNFRVTEDTKKLESVK
jgi:hypothetical protein